MFTRLVTATLFTVVMCILATLWLNSIQPHGMSGLVIQQLEQSDSAAHALRNAQTGQQYVYGTIVTIWIIGMLGIFGKYIRLGFLYLKERN